MEDCKNCARLKSAYCDKCDKVFKNYFKTIPADTFAQFDVESEVTQKIKYVSEKEYAKICLECPYKRCVGGHTGCDRTKKYRIKRKRKERNDKKKISKG